MTSISVSFAPVSRLTTIIGLAIFLFCRVARGNHDQVIQLIDPINFVSIMVVSGSNTVAELFSDAPVGTLAFKFDNARGYVAAQMYSNGWNNAGMTLNPSETAILMPPRNKTYLAHIEGERDYPLPPLYRGWNLAPVKAVLPLDPLRKTFTPKSGDEMHVYLKTGVFSRALYSAEQQRWVDLRVPLDGVWYYTTEWPTNPAGQFDLRGAIYFNNFAPAFGVDEPFLDANGCALSGTAMLMRQNPEGWEPVGASVPVLNGYVDPSSDLMRYLDLDDESASTNLAVSFITTEGTRLGNPFPAKPGRGLVPVGLSGFRFGRRPVFLSAPQTIAIEPGNTAQLEAVYNYRADGGPLPTNSLENVKECTNQNEACLIRFQWQRRTDDGEWVNVPNATMSHLSLVSVQERDYGAYRLKAAWGCREDFSASAALLPLTALTAIHRQATKSFDLTVSTLGAKQLKLELSADLINWQTYAVKADPTNSWVVTVPDTARKVFFRAIAIRPADDEL
jgi:hypothetical protein